MSDSPWFLYILKCADGTLYTGITNNIDNRLAIHNSGKGAKYTRARLPVELKYQEIAPNHSAAAIREAQIKKLSRRQKEELIEAR